MAQKKRPRGPLFDREKLDILFVLVSAYGAERAALLMLLVLLLMMDAELLMHGAFLAIFLSLLHVSADGALLLITSGTVLLRSLVGGGIVG